MLTNNKLYAKSLVNLHLYCKATQLTYSTAWKHNTNCSTMNASRPRKTAHWLLEWIIQHQTSIKASPCSLCSSQTLIEIPKQSHSAKDICPLNMVSNESFRKTWMDKRYVIPSRNYFPKWQNLHCTQNAGEQEKDLTDVKYLLQVELTSINQVQWMERKTIFYF